MGFNWGKLNMILTLLTLMDKRKVNVGKKIRILTTVKKNLNEKNL